MLRRLLDFIIAASLLGVPASSDAQATSDVAALRGELQAKSFARDDAKAQAESLRKEIVVLSDQLTELRSVAAAGERGLSAKRTRLSDLNTQEAALKADMGRNQADLARLLGALALYRRQPPPALLVTPRSAQDAVMATILIRAVEPELKRRADAFKAKAEEMQRIRRGADAVSEDLFTSESALAEGRATIERTLRQKVALERQLDADAVDADRRAKALTLTLRGLGEAADVQTRFAAAAPEHPPAFLSPPAEGALTQHFGQLIGNGQRSDGVTWRVGKGAAVRAPAAGVVEYSGALKGWSGVLIMDVGGGYHLVLAGLDTLSAVAGRPVAAGEAVGRMPERGSLPPDLYMELRKEGAPQDPARWLRTPPHAPAEARR